MKKQSANYLLAVCLILISFLLGYFAGKNLNHAPIQFSQNTVSPTEPQITVSTAPTQAAGRLDINTATKEQLMSLPGVGETLASRIIAYRDKNGAFQKVTDLMQVEGIGTKRLEALLDFITVGG